MSDRSNTETARQPVQPSPDRAEPVPILTYFAARTVRVSRPELPSATSDQRRSAS